MNLLARAVLSGSTDVVAHMYVIRLPWWVPGRRRRDRRRGGGHMVRNTASPSASLTMQTALRQASSRK